MTFAFACAIAVPVPSPFALAECFTPTAFSPVEPPARARVALAWDVTLEPKVDALLVLAQSGAVGHAFTELEVVSRARASNRVNLVIRGARRSCTAFLDLCATRDLEVQTAHWS